jgi:hypothetical protein
MCFYPTVEYIVHNVFYLIAMKFLILLSIAMIA